MRGGRNGQRTSSAPGLADLLDAAQFAVDRRDGGFHCSRTLGLRMRVNDDDALMRFLDSLGGDSAGGVL